jgi:hypothetical protein
MHNYILTGMPECKRLLGITRLKWEDDIKLSHRAGGLCRCRLDLTFFLIGTNIYGKHGDMRFLSSHNRESLDCDVGCSII